MKRSQLNGLLLLVTLAGALLVGFNAGRLHEGMHAAMFVLGIVLLSGAITLLGQPNMIRKHKKGGRNE